MDEIGFTIISETNCPLYALRDKFIFSGISLETPQDARICTVLVLDILEKLLDIRNELQGTSGGGEIQCSGCVGRISLSIGIHRSKEEVRAQDTDKNRQELVNYLRNLSLFKNISDSDIRVFLPLLRLKKFQKGEIVIRKGDPGENLYIILTGGVEVVGEDGMRIASLGKGEVFGEMSLLSGDPVGATIQVTEASRILNMNAKDFRKILNRFPTLQMYFAKLLAKRLARTNVGMSEEFSSGMAGKLSEMPPTELFQTLNQNQKTGVLHLSLENGNGEFHFREGGLVHADYMGKTGKEAFYLTLALKKGRFRFVPELPRASQDTPEIGDFMWLLMEGLNRIDEGQVVDG